ncbi:ATP-dependent rRNA helicase spb4 [Coemansia sp. Benny D115]|nr:ATP-dependent rRNA helicase spb4 [Coemansia sp. Benny D115]
MAQSVVPTFGRAWSTVKPALSDNILEAVSSMGFENMTPVQEATIPVFLQNNDVIVEAATGSGKTLAFIIPVLEMMQRRKGQLSHREVGAVIVSPTRELAKQISTVLQQVLDLTGLPYKAHLVVGGSSSATNTADEMSQLREIGPDILVGTPGRLEDVLCGRQRGSKKTKSGKIMASNGVRGKAAVSASKLEVLVLDEADRLLDMGFEASLTAILAVLPKQRRTGLFSATMNEALSQLVRTGLRNPARVQVQVQSREAGIISEQRVPVTLKIEYLVVPPDRKLAQILRRIQSNAPQKYIIYFSTCAAVDYFYRLLRRLLLPSVDYVPGGKKGVREERERTRKHFDAGFPIAVHSLHGQMVQKKRQATFEAFSSLPPGEAGILMCTDVASRGLDIPDVDCVVQWDPPTDPKSFAHRCGRTARAGRSGQALVFLNPGSEEAYVDFLALRKIPMVVGDYLWQDEEGHISATPPDDVAADFLSSSEGSDAEAEGEGEGEGQSMDVDSGAEQNKAKTKKKGRKHSALRKNYPRDTRSDALLEMLRELAATDRDIYARGKIAFVSYIQSYSKHDATFIFRLKELPIIEVAKGFALLHLPSMPELRGRPTNKFVRYMIDTDTIPFLDAKREASRLVKLEAEREEKLKRKLEGAEADKKRKKTKNNTEAWADTKEAKIKQRERKLKRIQMRDVKAQAEEERLMKEINDPKLLEALAKDPLLAKRMMNNRDKTLLDAVKMAKESKKRGSKVAPGQTLEQIIAQARADAQRRASSDDSSSSSASEDDWETIARKERIRAKMASKNKRPQFTFNPGFSDEEAEMN